MNGDWRVSGGVVVRGMMPLRTGQKKECVWDEDVIIERRMFKCDGSNNQTPSITVKSTVMLAYF